MRRTSPIATVLAGLASGCGASGAAPAPPPSGVFGTAHPGLVDAYDPAGRWMVICQAREDTDHDGKFETFMGEHGDPGGDRLTAWLIVGGGEGVPLGVAKERRAHPTKESGNSYDEIVGRPRGRLLAVDPTHRWVVGERTGRLVLHDTKNDGAVDLAPSLEDGTQRYSDSFASFDAAGRRLLTARVTRAAAGERTALVVRELLSGREHEIDPGPGLLVVATISANGRWIDATVVTTDTDGDGKLEEPRSVTTLYEGGCRGEVSSYSTLGGYGDVPTRRVIEVDGSRRYEAPGLVGIVGDRGLVRRSDGALFLQGEGPAVALSTDEEGAFLIGTDDSSGQVLLAARRGEVWHALLGGPAGVGDLGVPVASRDRDEFPPPARLTSVYDWGRRAVFTPKGRIVATFGGRALVLRGEGMAVVDAEDRTETVIPGKVEHSWDVRAAGAFVMIGGRVVDLRRAAVVGTYSTDSNAVLGIRDDGTLLMPDRPIDSDFYLPVGPFRWKKPDPPK